MSAWASTGLSGQRRRYFNVSSSIDTLEGLQTCIHTNREIIKRGQEEKGRGGVRRERRKEDNGDIS